MYQPTHPTPYLETIDAKAVGGNVFKCLINPRDAVYKYVLTIVSVDTPTQTVIIEGYIESNAQKKVIDHRVVELDQSDSVLPLKGTSNDGGWLQIYVPNNAYYFTNGRSYTWTLKLTDVSNNYITTPEYYFSAYAAPTASITLPEVWNSNHIKVSTSMSSPGDIISQKYILYHMGEVIDETEEMYALNPPYEYDGLMSGQTYTIEWQRKDKFDRVASATATFRVEYENRQTAVFPVAEYDPQNTCVEIDYSKNGVIEGKVEGIENIELKKYLVNGEAPDTTNAVSLQRNQNIYWDKINDRSLNLKDVYYALNWHGHQGFNGKIFEIIDEDYPLNTITAGYKDGSFYYKVGTLPEVTLFAYESGVTAKAVAGADDYSAQTIITSVDYSANTVTLSSATGITTDMLLLINGELYKIEAISGNVVTVSESLPSGNLLRCRVIAYREDTFYNLTEDMTLNETDILFDNELTSNYWWNIFVNGDTCQFVRGSNYKQTEVTA